MGPCYPKLLLSSHIYYDVLLCKLPSWKNPEILRISLKHVTKCITSLPVITMDHLWTTIIQPVNKVKERDHSSRCFIVVSKNGNSTLYTRPDNSNFPARPTYCSTGIFRDQHPPTEQAASVRYLPSLRGLSYMSQGVQKLPELAV